MPHSSTPITEGFFYIIEKRVGDGRIRTHRLLHPKQASRSLGQKWDKTFCRIPLLFSRKLVAEGRKRLFSVELASSVVTCCHSRRGGLDPPSASEITKATDNRRVISGPW